MTREEAKKRLEVWLICGECPEDKQCYDSYLHSTCEYTDYCDEVSLTDAVKVAISALSDYDKMQEISLDLAFENEEEETDDLISKQKVLNTLDFADNALTDEERTVEKYKELLTECIKVLSSAENKGEWIPVSERLPEERQSVLVWCPERRNIYCACLEKQQWWIFGAFMKVQDEVVAWMPLPEPYKAEKGGEE